MPRLRTAAMLLIWLAVGVLGLPLLAGASPTPSGSVQCSPEDRAGELASAQRQILDMLLHGTPGNLTVLENEADLAALAALGYAFYDRQQTSVRGMGWPVVDVVTADPTTGDPTVGRPTVLFYAPTPPPPPKTVTHPRDGFDFPYHLAGWAYAFPYSPNHPPSLFACIDASEWFVHERGIHTFDDGGFVPMRPAADEPRGSAVGHNPCPLFLCTDREPGDWGHGRLWDLHLWLGPEVPVVSLTNPGRKISGIDPQIGKAFFYPGISEDIEFFGCWDANNVISYADRSKVAPLVPEVFTAYGAFTVGSEHVESPVTQLALHIARCDQAVMAGQTLQQPIVAQLLVPLTRERGRYQDTECLDTQDLFPCDAYVLFWVTNHQAIADWLQAGTGLGAKVVVADLDFQLQPVTGHEATSPWFNFSFDASAPTPSPFRAEGRLADARRAPGFFFVGSYWDLGSEGIVQVGVCNDHLQVAPGTVEITPEPGSQMAELIGAQFTSADPFNTSFSARTLLRKRVLDAKQEPTALWPSERCT